MITQAKTHLRRLLPKNTFARGVSVLVGGTAAAQLLTVLAAPLLTRLYSPEDFGLLAVYGSLLALIGVISSLRYELAIPLPEDDGEAANVAVLSLILVGISALLSGVLVLLLGHAIADALGVPALAGYFWLLPVGVLLGGAYSVFNYWSVRTKRFGTIAGTKLSQALATVAIQLAGFKLGGIALLYAQVAGQRLQTVIVPVLWGAKQRHENAVHIYLPDSQTTWVYLNLDTNIHDFKFWMAHELGHCLSPSLEGEEAEDFADAFAGCLLFPHALAEEAYDRVCAGSSASARIKALLSIANEHVISPLTVERQVKHYASATGRPLIELSQGFHGAITNFNKGYQNLSAVLFPGSERDTDGRPLATDYVERSEAIFATPFFRMLSNYLKQLEKGPGFLEVVLDLPPLDARSLHAELA